MNQSAILKYFQHHFPEQYIKAVNEVQSAPIAINVLRNVYDAIAPSDYKSMYFICVCSLIYSPSTIKAGNYLRVGLISELACILNVSKPAISRRLPSIRHYYNNVSWFRENVDKIVKEVRGEVKDS